MKQELILDLESQNILLREINSMLKKRDYDLKPSTNQFENAKLIKTMETEHLPYNNVQIKRRMRGESQLLSLFDAEPGTKLYDYRFLLDQIEVELSKFGLARNESKICVFLTKYGSKTATEISTVLKIQRTENYRIISNLQNKGIVSATFGHPTIYSSISPDSVLQTLLNIAKEKIRFLKTQKNELVEIWKSIADFGSYDTERSSIINGVRNLECNDSTSFYKLKDMMTKFGLSPNQFKVYAFLEKNSPKKAIDICKALKLPRTETYRLLRNLKNIGILEQISNSTTQYEALSIDNALDVIFENENNRISNLEMQKDTLLCMWEKIPDFKMGTETQEEKFQILKGAAKINVKINEMFLHTKENVRVFGTEKFFFQLYHSDSLESLEKTGLDIQLLTSCSEKSRYIFNQLSNAKIKKIPKGVQEDLCFVTNDNNELLLIMKNKGQSSHDMLAIRTDSSSMINAMNLLFRYVWASSMTKYSSKKLDESSLLNRKMGESQN